MKFRLFSILFLAVLDGCSHSSVNEGISKSDDRLCTAAGMNVTQAPLAQAELVQRGLLTANEMQEAIQHRVHIGSSQCQVEAAFGSVTGSWKIDKDSKKRLIGKHFIFDCKMSPVQYCPYTSIDMVEEKVTSIRQVERGNLGSGPINLLN